MYMFGIFITLMELRIWD